MTPIRDKHYMVMQSLRNGEIVKLRTPEPLKNAFCLDCGHNFMADIKMNRVDESVIESEKITRGTEDLLEEYIQRNHIDVNAKPPLGGLFSGLTNF